MSLSDLIEPEDVIVGLKATSKKQAFQELASIAAERLAAKDVMVTGRRVLDLLLERERLGATGIGEGVAVPHTRLTELDQMVTIFARLDSAIDYDAMDDGPVDLLFVLFAPEEARADHLKTLARVTRMMRDPAIRRKLRGATDAQAAFTLLTDRTAQAA